jgi:hypothetical protein
LSDLTVTINLVKQLTALTGHDVKEMPVFFFPKGSDAGVLFFKEKFYVKRLEHSFHLLAGLMAHGGERCPRIAIAKELATKSPP